MSGPERSGGGGRASRPVRIEPAVPAAAAEVRALVTAAFEGYIPRIGRPPAPMAADHAALIEAGAVWIARGTGQTGVGVLVLLVRPDHLLIDTIAVHPRAQGQGIGAALLDFADAHARGLGLEEIRLYTNAAMHENIAYYPRRGYTETHRAPGAGFHRVYFAKRLAAP